MLVWPIFVDLLCALVEFSPPRSASIADNREEREEVRERSRNSDSAGTKERRCRVESSPRDRSREREETRNDRSSTASAPNLSPCACFYRIVGESRIAINPVYYRVRRWRLLLRLRSSHWKRETNGCCTDSVYNICLWFTSSSVVCARGTRESRERFSKQRSISGKREGKGKDRIVEKGSEKERKNEWVRAR